ncbi:MAG: TIGR02391 family protein, partial [Gammaproteobacteria bacterium]|nr:TIGR02391 family protein [Gammaproteobacteria bacterium]
MLSGPPGLRLIKGLNNEALSGVRKGHRYSCLGLQWRILRFSKLETESERSEQQGMMFLYSG